MLRSVFAAESPPQEKPSAAGSEGSEVAAPDYRAEVSEVHTQLARSNILRTQQPALPGSLLAAASPPQEKPSAAASGGTVQRSSGHFQCRNDYLAEVSEAHKNCHIPFSRQQALRRRSRAQRQAGVLRSVQRSTASEATTRNATEGVRASTCFQHSTYTARSATHCAALHCAQR